MKTRALFRLLAFLFIIAAGEAARAIDHSAEAARHWAFQPLRAPEIPAGNCGLLSVVCFFAAKLKVAGLAISTEADRATLIRRVAFTLTGLPPTPEEIERFAKDGKAGAYERMVERYLS